MFRKSNFLIILFLFSFGNLLSQQEKGIYGNENWLSIWTDFNPNNNEYKVPTQILTGTISHDTKLLKKETYLLLGNVFVTDSTSLTIEPGTVILADYKTKASLIIGKDSKIIAEGTQTDPIIFSSNRSVKKKGDWGGIFILGDAPVNNVSDEWPLENILEASSPEIVSYGGDDMASSSGVLKYVRIEYAGKRTKNYGYFSGLTLAGVGNETVLENIMISYCEGSSFYLLGGNTVLSQIVSFRSRQNDLILNYGAQSLISNSLVIKSPYFTASSGASSIYLASYNSKEQLDPTQKTTHLNAENLTLLVLSEDLKRDTEVGLVNEAMFVERGASFSMRKTIFSGYNPAVILDDDIPINSQNLSKMEFNSMYFNNCKGNIFTKGIQNNEDLENWYGNRIFRNVYSRGSDSETFIDTTNLEDPDFRLRINRIIASNLPDEE